MFSHGGGITRGDAGGALAGWWWHHSRRRRDCSRVLTACIQTTSLKGAQGVLWRVSMNPSARCFFFRTHFHSWFAGWLIVQATRSEAPRSRDAVPSRNLWSACPHPTIFYLKKTKTKHQNRAPEHQNSLQPVTGHTSQIIISDPCVSTFGV
jgi:hypothetical protein